MWYYTLLTVLFFHYGSAYQAAVVEHYPLKGNSTNETITINLKEYEKYANGFKTESVEILVFPEYGLTTFVEDPEEYAINLNDTDNPVLVKLKTIATDRQIYMVVNLLEKETTDDKTLYYSTNLVYNRAGEVITKYRKINLYNEPKLTPGATDQQLTFDTEFGTTFGIFTGIDILFNNPSRVVLNSSKIVNIVYPTAWVSKEPFYHSLSVQQGYVKANGVNLLAANYGKPKEGRGGSGIFTADGKIVKEYIGDTASSQPLSGSVGITKRNSVSICSSIAPQGLPSDLDKSPVQNYSIVKSFTPSKYKFEDVDLTKSETTTTVCHHQFCCTFQIRVNTPSVSDTYKVMAFDGTDDYTGRNVHIRVCSLVVCENNDIETCGIRSTPLTNFTKITVSGNLPKDSTSFYTPITLDSELQPLTQTHYCDTKNGTNSTFVELTSYKAPSKVLAFGLFGVTEIPPPNGDNSAGSQLGHAILTTLTLILVKMLF